MGQNEALWLAVAKRLIFLLLALVILGLAVGSGGQSPSAIVASALELLQNGGFEQGTGPWQAYNGGFTVVSSADAPGRVHSGNYAAAFASADLKTKWLYQLVQVVPGGSYTFSGWAIKDDADISAIYLRVSWYSSQDGTGSEIGHNDSTWLSGDSSAYRDVTVSATAPSQALSARVKLVLFPAAEEPATAYFDDLSFTGPEPVLAKVVEIVDGDTIKLESGETVRYIGVDTPEQGELFYDEATNKNKELVEGKTVRLEKDISETDQFGRLLRYVYIDGTFVNAEMVRLGYARATPYPPDTKYEGLFSQMEGEAKNAGLGIWALDHVFVAPSNATLDIGGTQQFSATAYDQYDNVIPGIAFTWSVGAGGGGIDGNGLFTAGTAAGTFPGTVKAETAQGAITRSDTATVTVNTDHEQTAEEAPTPGPGGSDADGEQTSEGTPAPGSDRSDADGEQTGEGTATPGRSLLTLVLAPILAFIGLACLILALFRLRKRR